MHKLLPFRIHFEDPEIAPLDLEARDAEMRVRSPPPAAACRPAQRQWLGAFLHTGKAKAL